MRGLFTVLSAGLLFLAAPSGAADELPAGTTIEVRLSSATGSRDSHAGDRVEGTVIAPVLLHGSAVIPQGATVFGTVASVRRLGFGLRHLTAGIVYRFHTLQLPDGETSPIETRLIEVEMAKERVNADGSVGGIHPTANLSSSVSFYALPFLYATPAVAGPALAIKFLIARSPDPEIYFPAGTEMILQLTADASIQRPDSSQAAIAPLPADQIAEARMLLGGASLPPLAAKKSGRPSDRVNIVILGSRDQIDRAFHAAGWAGANGRSPMTIYRMYHSLVERIGYSMAPMQKLTLKGRPADAVYEKSLNTFSKRHHLRLWKEQESGFWLSAASEDVSYKFHRMRLTHATDPRIDNERAKVVNDLNFTGCLESATLLAHNSTDEPDQSPRSIVTDGGVALVRLNECRNPRSMPAVNFGPGRHCRFVRGLVALRKDITRSNLVFLAYNTAKLLHAKPRSQEPPAEWVRDSVLYSSSGSGGR